MSPIVPARNERSSMWKTERCWDEPSTASKLSHARPHLTSLNASSGRQRREQGGRPRTIVTDREPPYRGRPFHEAFEPQLAVRGGDSGLSQRPEKPKHRNRLARAT